MTNRKFILSALARRRARHRRRPIDLAAAARAGAGGSPDQPRRRRAARPRPPRERPSHIEGRIAYLKAELKITPAQEAQFDKVAQAMRLSDTERRQSFEQMRARRTAQPQQRPNALQQLETSARLAAMRAQQADRFLAAFRPLYDGLSDTQKKAADELLTRHFGHRFGHRHA